MYFFVHIPMYFLIIYFTFILQIFCKDFLFEQTRPTGLSGTVDPLQDPFALPGRNGLPVKEDLVALRSAVGGYGYRPGFRNI